MVGNVSTEMQQPAVPVGDRRLTPRAGVQAGLITGGVNIFFVLIGFTTLVGTLLQKWLGLPSSEMGAWLLLLLVASWGGSRAAGRVRSSSWLDIAIASAVAGVVHGLLIASLVALLAALETAGFDLRKWLVQLSTQAITLITLGRPPAPAAGTMFAALFGATVAGGLFKGLRERNGWGAALRGFTRGIGQSIATAPFVERGRANPATRRVAIVLAVAMLLAAPFFLGQYWNYTLGTVGIYVILGLGLNVVVGMAGLLDLGYVAFFAVGAYVVAILTAPAPHNIQMSFWLVLPIGVAVAALAGVLLGIPVLRMRGDYLAIVTLGFGEIIRILSRSDVLLSFTGGPRGIRAVGHPMLFGKDIGNEFYFMYLIVLGILLVIFLTRRLEGSRIGRAWRAMREDETVAEAMGIYTLKYKLLAFATGAAFAGLSGVVFASRNSFTGPEDFTLLVSINVLALVIVGGMGSIPGVIMGALVLKGLPEILRELQDYRMLAFGALLVFMMIVRPAGLWPSSQVRLERAKESKPVLEEG